MNQKKKVFGNLSQELSSIIQPLGTRKKNSLDQSFMSNVNEAQNLLDAIQSPIEEQDAQKKKGQNVSQKKDKPSQKKDKPQKSVALNKSYKKQLQQSIRKARKQYQQKKKEAQKVMRQQQREIRDEQFENDQLSLIEQNQDESVYSVQNGEDFDADEKTNKYKWGDFSKFAYQQEEKASVTQQLVENIIRQALQSHKKQVKSVLQIQQALRQQSKKHFLELKTLLKLQKESDFQEYLKDPEQYFLKKTKLDVEVGELINSYITTLLTANQYIIAENNIIKKRQLNVSQFLLHQQQAYIPLRNYQNLYFKDSSQSFNFLIDGKFRQKQEMKLLSPEQRQIIITTVKMFLKQKGILVGDNSLAIAIKKQLQDKNT